MTVSDSYGSTIDLLNEVAEFLEGQADVRDGSDGPRPNKAMELMARAEIEIERLKRASLSGPSHKPAAVEALKGVLDEIEDYLEQRQDVRDGSDGPRANTEMSLLSDLRWWRDSAGMCSATKENV
jgi:hypothetical protein